ncbi:MAG: ribonuclease domain-containing protein [Propioniciclava sp.]
MLAVLLASLMLLAGCVPLVSAPVASVSALPSADLESGLAWVSVAELPPEAADTLTLIEVGPPYPYRADGETFGNREGLLPDRPRGYYREFTVETPGSSDRGARRIVVGERGDYYWTEDHYASFRRIRQ